MLYICFVLFTLILFSEMSSHLVAVAMPANKVDYGVLKLNGLGLLLGDEPMTCCGSP